MTARCGCGTPRRVNLKGTLTGHTALISDVVFSPDGKTLASGSWDRTVRLWDTETGELRQTLTGVYRVVFSPDGTTVASWSGVWDAKTGEKKQALTGYTVSVYSVAFSPDGKTLASGSGDGTVRLWDVKTREPKQVFTGHKSVVKIVAFSPDWQDACQWGRGQDGAIVGCQNG